MMNYKSRVISALKAQALADKEKALMALDLLENKAVGIGDHTSNDFLKDANESLMLLAEAEDKLDMIEKYFTPNSPLSEKIDYSKNGIAGVDAYIDADARL
jgi:hypothetical protein